MKATPANIDRSCLRIPWIDSAEQRRIDPLRIGYTSDNRLSSLMPQSNDA